MMCKLRKRGGLMHSQKGQASLEWVGVVMLVALVLAGSFAAAAATGFFNGRAFGGTILEEILCAVHDAGSCMKESAQIDAYGKDDAEMVRNLAPNIVYEKGMYALPVDFRRCRRDPRCSDGPDVRGLVSRSFKGKPVTAFTHVRDKDGYKYIQYWFYYSDSASGLGQLSEAGRKSVRGWAKLKKKDPYHLDDWESFQVRVSPDGKVHARASAHDHYQTCKGSELKTQLHNWKSKLFEGDSCANRWTEITRWNRASGGSHANHITAGDTFERFTPSASLKLVPIETLSDKDKNTQFAVTKPWKKHVYTDPASWSTK